MDVDDARNLVKQSVTIFIILLIIPMLFLPIIFIAKHKADINTTTVYNVEEQTVVEDLKPSERLKNNTVLHVIDIIIKGFIVVLAVIVLICLILKYTVFKSEPDITPQVEETTFTCDYCGSIVTGHKLTKCPDCGAPLRKR